MSTTSIAYLRSDVKQSVPFLPEYLDFIGDTSHCYYQQDRNPTNLRWKGSSSATIDAEKAENHLQGNATLGAYFHRDRLVSLLVADDDHGGIAAAQAAVNHLLDHGLVAFALCYESVLFDGTPRHNGSHLYLKLDSTIITTEAKAALAAILDGVYSTAEIQGRCMLPFGLHKWAKNPYGTLITPYADPVALVDCSGHALGILAELDILQTRNDANHLLSFMPAATTLPASPAELTSATERDETKPSYVGGHRDVVKAYNARYTAFDALQDCGFTLTSRHNARCNCNKHAHGDTTASIGISSDEKIYFNAPACDYHNNGRAFTAFSLMQYVKHNGNYFSAIDEARSDLNMAFKVIKPRVKSSVRLPVAKPVEMTKQTIDAIIKEYKSYAEKLTDNQKSVLRIICDKARKTDGYTSLTWESLSRLARVPVSSCKYAVRKFVKDGMLVKFADSTEENQSSACVFQMVAAGVVSIDFDSSPVMENMPLESHADSGTLTPPLLLKKESIDQGYSVPAKSDNHDHAALTKTESGSPDTVFSFFNSSQPGDKPQDSGECVEPASVDSSAAPSVKNAPRAAQNGPGTMKKQYAGNCPADLQEKGYNAAALRFLQPIWENDSELAAMRP